jgi:hypothetical protein
VLHETVIVVYDHVKDHIKTLGRVRMRSKMNFWFRIGFCPEMNIRPSTK